MNLLWIALGGAAGSVLRHEVGVLAARRGATLPWGTLAVNVVGALVMSALMAGVVASGRLPEAARLGLTTGLLGGFTTYSSFNHEVLALASGGHWGRAAGYVALTVCGCLAAGAAGWLVGRALAG